jgi:hypothetical protein
VVEGGVDHAVGPGGAVAQAVEVGEVAPERLDPGLGEPPGAGVGPGEAEDLVPGRLKLRYQGRADEAGGAGEEDAHGSRPLTWKSPSVGARSILLKS